MPECDESFYIDYSKVNKIAFNMDLTAFKSAIKLSSLYYERVKKKFYMDLQLSMK